MKPFQKGVVKPRSAEFVSKAAVMQGVSETEVIAMLDRDVKEGTIWINDIYQVQAHEIDGGWTHLNIRRRDGNVILRDWRHFQKIKNELCGPEREGLELYPAESRLVDSSNKYHIYVAPAGMQIPIGWSTRDVRDDDGERQPGFRQRKFI